MRIYFCAQISFEFGFEFGMCGVLLQAGREVVATATKAPKANLNEL